MKKLTSIITILTVVLAIMFINISYAASLGTIDIKTSKTTINPGEEVRVNINFGENLGTYTVNVAYDNNIFEYVSVDGGTANDTSSKVNVVFHDTTGGTAPRNNMSLTFRAKSDITTSNPTQFIITAEGLANADASVIFDDITTPIVKNVTVEPQYVDYKIKFEYPDKIVKGKETEMKISYSSTMGRYYDHARLVAEATTPAGGTVKLLAKDQASVEYDIIQNGWGAAQGYGIGGKDVAQVLSVTGIFSEEGTYNIKLTLIDKDDSDKAIASTIATINVLDEAAKPAENTPAPQAATPQAPAEQAPAEQAPAPAPNTTENAVETPNKLPKTGRNIYIPAVFAIVVLMVIYVYNNTKKKGK